MKQKRRKRISNKYIVIFSFILLLLLIIIPAILSNPDFMYRSRAAGSGDPVIAAAGDMVCGSANVGKGYPCKDKETASLVKQINPSALLVLGDNQYESGSYTDYQTYYSNAQSWGQFKSITYPVPGNHEYGSSGAAGYFDYFNGKNVATGRAGTRGQGYYSFNLGSWHIIALNSNCTKASFNGGHGCDAGSPQELWLKQDLAANRATCTLAFMHHAFYTSGNKDMPALKPLIQALYDGGADLMLVGHKHMYERFAPQNPNGQLDNAKGIREIVVGTGGRDVTGVSNVTYPNLMVRNGKTFGILKVTLHSAGYDWAFIPMTGQTFTDAGTGQCH